MSCWDARCNFCPSVQHSAGPIPAKLPQSHVRWKLYRGQLHEAELRRLRRCHAGRVRIWIVRALVRVVGALFAMRNRVSFAARRGRFVAAVVGAQALHGCPRLDEHAVGREVIAGAEAPQLGAATSALSNRPRLVKNVEWSHTASSMPSPANQRNSRLSSITSTGAPNPPSRTPADVKSAANLP